RRHQAAHRARGPRGRPRPGGLVRQPDPRRRRQPRILPPCSEMNPKQPDFPAADLSFEFFPPNTPEGARKLRDVRARLAALSPGFFRVTYGAGGATREKTLAIVDEIAAEGRAVAPHLSCIGATRESVAELLDGYRARGIRRLVALRGD